MTCHPPVHVAGYSKPSRLPWAINRWICAVGGADRLAEQGCQPQDRRGEYEDSADFHDRHPILLTFLRCCRPLSRFEGQKSTYSA